MGAQVRPPSPSYMSMVFSGPIGHNSLCSRLPPSSCSATPPPSGLRGAPPARQLFASLLFSFPHHRPRRAAGNRRTAAMWIDGSIYYLLSCAPFFLSMLLLMANFDLSPVSSQCIPLGADGAAGDGADGVVSTAGAARGAGTERPPRRSAAQPRERHYLRTPGNDDRDRGFSFLVLEWPPAESG